MICLRLLFLQQDKYVLFGLVFQCLMVAQNALASIFGEQDSIAKLFDLISLIALAAIIIIAQIVFIIMAVIKVRGHLLYSLLYLVNLYFIL